MRKVDPVTYRRKSVNIAQPQIAVGYISAVAGQLQQADIHRVICAPGIAGHEHTPGDIGETEFRGRLDNVPGDRIGYDALNLVSLPSQSVETCQEV